MTASWRGLLGIALASASVAGGAAAQAKEPFQVTQDLYVILPGSRAGADWTVAPGETVLRGTIGYSAAAKPAEPVSAHLAGVQVDVAADIPLPEMRPSSATRARLGADARIFCGSQRRPDMIAAPPSGPPGRGRRFDDYVYPCLVDGDRDGKLESIFLGGVRWASESLLVPIAPIAYSEQKNVPLMGSVWITYEKGGDLQLHAVYGGHVLPIRGVRLGAERKHYPAERNVRRSSYPFVVPYGSAAISVLGFEPDGGKLRIRVDRAFEIEPLELD